ncbi:MAG: radical SAM protein, partial [Candidatus Cloacimonadota bacterium]
MEKNVEILPLKQGIIYGPVNSRRLGCSLGLNLSPDKYKLCSFNCIYCHFGWTKQLTNDISKYRKDFPTKENIFFAVRNALQTIKNLDCVTFSGDGEPTLHPDFENIVNGVRELCDELLPETPLAVLSNSSNLKNDSVIRAFSKIDLKILKLDAGIESIFIKINKPVHGISLGSIIGDLKRQKDIIIQSIFVKGSVDNTQEENLAAWIKALAEIMPKKVQIYSTDRPVAEKQIEKVSKKDLEAIARRTIKETGIP